MRYDVISEMARTLVRFCSDVGMEVYIGSRVCGSEVGLESFFGCMLNVSTDFFTIKRENILESKGDESEDLFYCYGVLVGGDR